MKLKIPNDRLVIRLFLKEEFMNRETAVVAVTAVVSGYQLKQQ